MRAFILAMVALVAIAFGAEYALEQAGFSAADKGSSSNVRLGE